MALGTAHLVCRGPVTLDSPKRERSSSEEEAMMLGKHELWLNQARIWLTLAALVAIFGYAYFFGS